MAYLEGTFIVRCTNGHDDRVDGTTANHDCETCGAKSVDWGAANVVCPNGHADLVGGITTQHVCSHCGAQCRR